MLLMRMIGRDFDKTYFGRPGLEESQVHKYNTRRALYHTWYALVHNIQQERLALIYIRE
mgnify:CR=1 FL=1